MPEPTNTMEYSSPIYVSRYDSDSGEDAQHLKENPEIYRWRGKCKDRKDDKIYEWLKDNAINLDSYDIEGITGHFLLSGKNGVLYNLILVIDSEVLQELSGAFISDYVWRHHLTIKPKSATKKLPTNLVKILNEMEYKPGKDKIDKSLMTLPNLSNV